MPVEPVPCPTGGDSTPVEVTTCCAPSIASAALCRPDGSTVLLVVRSGCVECGEAAPDPTVVGWIDAATGVFTPGPAPTDTGPCDSGCLGTVTRELCDDTDGDGQADATYSELWCIHPDGTASVVLTYQDDPSTPYVPVAPVECTYGCADSETVTLCDDSGSFLRRYSFLNGIGTYEDVALDGHTPHVVIGTVAVCTATADPGTGTDCASPTTPAATLGLCLADGTPIAVVVTRDCDGVTTRDGWLNLTTGAYSVGDPPAGAQACGDARSIQVSGTFCDVDAAGDVVGLVLIEYSYDADGAIAGVRLVDAVTGGTYTPAGTVTTCPAGVAQPERDLVQLCDTAADGTVTGFVRDYGRDENGAITGHADYDLAGAPYTPAGNVGLCGSPCQDCQTLVLCDTDLLPAATIAGTAASGTLSNGVAWAATAPSAFPPGRQSDGAAWWGTALFPNPTVPLATWTFDQPVTVEFSVAMVWVNTGAAGENTVQLPAGAVPVQLPAGYSYNRTTHVLTAGLTLTGCTLNSPTRAASARFRVTGVSSFALRYLGSRVLNVPCQRFGSWEFGALDVSLGGQFLRTVCRDCDGATTSTTDTTLAGAAYTPVGAVGVCEPAAAEPGVDVELTPMCVVDNASGGIIQRVLAEARYDAETGVRLSVTYVDPATWGPVALPGGTHLDLCPAEEAAAQDAEVIQLCDLVDGDEPVPFLRHLLYLDGAATPTVTDTDLDGTTPFTPAGTVGICSTPCDVQQVIEQCRCDDTDGDGLPDVGYVELLAVDCDGVLSSLGTYDEGLTGPYTPVAPVDCDAADDTEGGPVPLGVQARRVELADGETWDATAFPTLQSVTAVAHGGTGTVTTADGTSTLYAGEAATWSVSRDLEAALIGPLTITAGPGPVTVNFVTGGVQL